MIIKFVPGTSSIEKNVPCPEPSKTFIPQWYKDIPGDKNTINVKKCIPFLDSLSHGYIQKTWTDIYVKNKNGQITFEHDSETTMFLHRPETNIPISDNFYEIEFIWQRPWSVILPEGMSAIITHPLNRLDLPFNTLSGVVDFDQSIHAPIGNIPFFIKKDFIGIIPKGTPMFQIIPFERYDWISEKQEYSDEFWNEKINERKEIINFYKKRIWNKKTFN